MRTLHIVTLFLSVTLIGCGDPSRPSDLPKLYPCVITITQDGKPLEGASVELVADGAKYQPIAITGADGAVKMSTYGFDGVPQGKYKAVVSKNVDDDFVYGVNSAGEKEVKEYTMYRTVEPLYSSAETTPLEIEVSGKGKSEKTFDVGKAVKEKI